MIAAAATTTTTTTTATTDEQLCAGYRCLDRDACFAYDDAAKVARHEHDSVDCHEEATIVAQTIPYIDKASGDVRQLSLDAAQELMRCTYANKLLFQRATILRNYAFWGFTGTDADGFEEIGLSEDKCTSISPKVAIGHVSSLADVVDDNALGLFATADIAANEYIGEYTGVIQVKADTTSLHDPYGICYPSVFEGGELYITATEFGNVVRCINHSATPNASFSPMILRGILHIYCFTKRPIAAGEQIFVDYGQAYWQNAGIEPIEC